MLLLALLACQSDKAPEPVDTVVTDSPVDTQPPEDTGPFDVDGDGYPAAQDCDDNDPERNPGATEVCDEIDNDCDGLVDNDDDSLDASDQTPVCTDDDGDGFGTDVCYQACEGPFGVTNSDDCDDTDASIHPDAEEICDGVDQNCDGADTPCALVLDFTDPETAERFVFETNGCTDGGLEDGALKASCPNNLDSVHWLDLELSGYSRLSITATLTSSAWNDAGPRVGVDFGGGAGSEWSAWGPLQGYSFLQADPLDSAQFGLCSHEDRCPSITGNHTTILDLANESTGEGTYTFSILLDATQESFALTHPNGATSQLSSTDASFRDGYIGLHCSEGDCAWSALSIAVE